MKDYLAIRAEGEAMIRASGIPATFLRPWYVLGPGHRWPSVLTPLYWLCERIPANADWGAPVRPGHTRANDFRSGARGGETTRSCRPGGGSPGDSSGSVLIHSARAGRFVTRLPGGYRLRLSNFS
jgi:uncharacterized protein YbjT (DUF2867 family)